MSDQSTVDSREAWPKGMGRPAQDALENAGITRIEDLTHHSEAEIRALHGVGPKALAVLRETLAAKGLSFRAA